MSESLSTREKALMRTLRGDGHDPEEISELTDRSLRTVMRHLSEPASVQYLAFKVKEITDAADGALGAAAMFAVDQLIACLYEAEPKDKPAIAVKLLNHWETIQKIRKEQGTTLKAEHLRIERSVGHPLENPENMTEAERLEVIKKTALGDKT